ncbi:MAG: DNA polymerase [Thermoleophilia bacterium]|nr:DNA polymerase [Thermoleophilia bacterium]
MTRLDRLWWPVEGITKGDVVRYYRAVSPVLLPHLRDRPFTMKRHYTSPRSPFQWVKDAPPDLPAWIRTSEQPAKSRGGAPVRYALVNDELALLWMVEFGCVDLHVWTAREDRPDRADAVVFDLDPADVAFADVAAAALLLRDALAALELEAFPMTTGGAGLHVRVPVARVHQYAEIREFAELLAGVLCRAAPQLVTGERSPGKRRGVFVDAKMNGLGQQVVAPYSVRPLPGAPVATPVTWEELERGVRPGELSLDAVTARVGERGDLLAGALGARQRLAAALGALR